jgi:hypothetical protein
VRIGLCSMVVAKRGAATCAMRIPDTITPLARMCRVPQKLRRTVPGVIVTATLSRQGKVVATRRVCVR